MSRLLILLEGQTEETFIKQLIAPHLAERGVFASVTMIATSRDAGRRTHRGGHAHRFDLIASDLRRLLGGQARAVSTMLDLYGFPRDMPGFPPRWPPATRDRVGLLEAAFAAAIGDHRFIPGIVAHEFEALLFTEPERIAAVAVPDLTERARATTELVAVAQAYASPEDINDSPATAPSKRILAAVPGYKKPRHGPIIAQQIGLERLRRSCPLFAAWLARLEALGEPTAPT